MVGSIDRLHLHSDTTLLLCLLVHVEGDTVSHSPEQKLLLYCPFHSANTLHSHNPTLTLYSLQHYYSAVIKLPQFEITGTSRSTFQCHNNTFHCQNMVNMENGKGLQSSLLLNNICTNSTKDTGTALGALLETQNLHIILLSSCFREVSTDFSVKALGQIYQIQAKLPNSFIKFFGNPNSATKHRYYGLKSCRKKIAWCKNLNVGDICRH